VIKSIITVLVLFILSAINARETINNNANAKITGKIVDSISRIPVEYASCQFSNTLAAEFFGNFNSPRNEAQGKYPSFTTYSFAIRKQFWNKNGSLAITANNPFKENVNQRTSLFGPQFVVNSVRSIPFGSVGINLTWKFGRLEFKKDKERDENINPPAEQ